ncbi:MAG: ABC transporter ATP-binding protein, partial [Proteobacteria bacterium]|nr:ABC transporter ATP-binding protein [Pseudomonadota bacterium]
MLRETAQSSITVKSYLGVFRYSRRAVELVWSTHKGLTIALALLTVTAGVLPAGIAYVGKLIVDAVVAQIDVVRLGGEVAYGEVLWWVLVEGLLVA